MHKSVTIKTLDHKVNICFNLEPMSALNILYFLSQTSFGPITTNYLIISTILMALKTS